MIHKTSGTVKFQYWQLNNKSRKLEIMDFNKLEDIKTAGFKGFKNVKELWIDSSEIPDIKGVYLVLNSSTKLHEFILPGVGGFFKDKNPNISIEELETNWVESSNVIYIGKAGSLNGEATLRKRIRQYLRFGQGKKVGHWGGRLIWQLSNHEELIFCWKEISNQDPREVEKELIGKYARQFGCRPFANLTG